MDCPQLSVCGAHLSRMGRHLQARPGPLLRLRLRLEKALTRQATRGEKEDNCAGDLSYSRAVSRIHWRAQQSHGLAITSHFGGGLCCTVEATPRSQGSPRHGTRTNELARPQLRLYR